jgi:serine/threonine protein kinase
MATLCYTRKGCICPKHRNYRGVSMDNKPRRPPASRLGSAPAGTPPQVDDEPALQSTRATGGDPETEKLGPVSSVRLNQSSKTAGGGDKSSVQLGEYRLVKKIGSGAMGAVYKARQVGTNRKVALKVLFQHVAANDKLVKRFHREAKVTTALNHPNIVRGYDVGQDQGFHYFAMEYVNGHSLQKWLAHLGKLSLGDALLLVLSCAKALQHAHEHDVIHRDIKPDNILITRDGIAKVADLGMVKMLDEDMSLTQTGHAVGTPWYMPLEQAKNSKDTDGRCDIYALGCVFYACLTGQPPFVGKTLVEVIQAKERGSFKPARDFNQEVTQRVDDIVVKMTAKLPRYRYQTCAELIKDLESIGLANKKLKFLPTSDATAKRLGGGQPPPSSDEQSTSTRTPFPTKSKTLLEDVWFIRYKRSDGKVAQQKLSTPQVLHLLELPNFDPTEAEASRSATEGYRALATYKEFAGAALGRSSKSNADKLSVRQRKLIHEIVEQEMQREKPKEPEVSTFHYWSSIFWRCAGVCLLLLLLFLAVAWVVEQLKRIF